jgi:hypothetical protein
MLVCNVSLLRRRAAIAADVAETTTAIDAPGTGNVVFATLVDDPASVREFVDAFLGQIMREAASATATVNAGLVYAVRVDEAITAIATISGAVPTAISAAVVETASAADAVDGTKVVSSSFDGVLALDGPIPPMAVQPTVILIEG